MHVPMLYPFLWVGPRPYNPEQSQPSGRSRGQSGHGPQPFLSLTLPPPPRKGGKNENNKSHGLMVTLAAKILHFILPLGIYFRA